MKLLQLSNPKLLDEVKRLARCERESTADLIVPATVENIALRCRAHNQYEARLDFGPDLICEHEAEWVVDFSGA